MYKAYISYTVAGNDGRRKTLSDTIEKIEGEHLAEAIRELLTSHEYNLIFLRVERG